MQVKKAGELYEKIAENKYRKKKTGKEGYKNCEKQNAKLRMTNIWKGERGRGLQEEK